MKIEQRLQRLEDAEGDVKIEENNTVFDKRDINALKSQAELDSLTIENNLRSEELESRKQDRAERKMYAKISFWFLSLYMFFIFVILFFNGFGLCGFSFDNSVLITLITTTTANVIGIFAFVMMYLFNKQKGQE